MLAEISEGQMSVSDVCDRAHQTAGPLHVDDILCVSAPSSAEVKHTRSLYSGRNERQASLLDIIIYENVLKSTILFDI